MLKGGCFLSAQLNKIILAKFLIKFRNFSKFYGFSFIEKFQVMPLSPGHYKHWLFKSQLE